MFNCLAPIAKILADQGNDLIIDEVILNPEELKLYLSNLVGHKIYFIGVYCELETMQEREILRGDRVIGLSNYQIDKVHNGMEYDLEMDTTHKSSFRAAKEIMKFIEENAEPKSFKRVV